MFSFLTSKFFKCNWSPLIIFKNSSFEKNSKHITSPKKCVQEPLNDDRVLLMKTPKRNLGVHSENAPYITPKLVLKRLNIEKTDNILIKGNKIYINNKDMAGPQRTVRRDFVVKDGKTYIEYQDMENSNLTSWECSLLYNKNKTQIKMSASSTENGSSYAQNKPLRQINGNAQLKSATFLSHGDGQEMLNGADVEFVFSSNQSHKKYDRGCYPPKQKAGRLNGKASASLAIKPLKRLNSNTPMTLLSHFKNVLSGKLKAGNHFKTAPKSFDPFHNRCDIRMRKKTDPDRARTNEPSSPKKCSLGHKMSDRSTGQHYSCNVTLERIDAKICFMHYLGLKPIVKTDIKILNDLLLLRKYNIKNCKVVISKTIIVAGRKR